MLLPLPLQLPLQLTLISGVSRHELPKLYALEEALADWVWQPKEDGFE